MYTKFLRVLSMVLAIAMLATTLMVSSFSAAGPFVHDGTGPLTIGGLDTTAENAQCKTNGAGTIRRMTKNGILSFSFVAVNAGEYSVSMNAVCIGLANSTSQKGCYTEINGGSAVVTSLGRVAEYTDFDMGTYTAAAGETVTVRVTCTMGDFDIDHFTVSFVPIEEEEEEEVGPIVKAFLPLYFFFKALILGRQTEEVPPVVEEPAVEEDPLSNVEWVAVEAAPAEGTVAIKAIAASGMEADTNPPILAADGNISTYWACEGSSGVWYMLDIGEATEISGVNIVWMNCHKRQMIFNIEVSADGKTWTKVFDGQSALQAADKTLEYFAFSEKVSARYVRINPFGNTVNAKNTAAEFQIVK